MEKNENTEQKFVGQGFDQPYRPAKLPTYLGLFIEDSEASRVHNYIVEGLEQLVKSYKDDKAISQACEELKNGSSSLELIKDMHVTSLFIGGKKSATSSEHFVTFKPGFQQDLELVGFIFVPGKLVTGICYPDQSAIKIENEFPHMTLMKGAWAPKFSNDLMKLVCGKGGPLQKEYQKQEFVTQKEFTYKCPVQVGKGSGTAYIVKTLTNLVLQTTAKAMN